MNEQHHQTAGIIKSCLSNLATLSGVLQLSETLHANNEDTILRIGSALSSKTRLTILKLLLNGEEDVTRVAKHLNGTEANASAQIKILSEAGLLECRYEPGLHGLKKISKTKTRRIIIELE